jgi:hypothetical protein
MSNPVCPIRALKGCLRSLARSFCEGETPDLVSEAAEFPEVAEDRLDLLDNWALAGFPLNSESRSAYRRASRILRALDFIGRLGA